MVSDPRFDPEPTHQEAPPREKSGCSSCLTGCGVVALIVFVLLLIGVAVVWFYGRGWFAGFASQAVEEGINATALPEAEKQETIAQVRRVTDAFGEGKLSWQQLGVVIGEIAQSPVMTTLIVSAAEKKYIDSSGLNEEEKAEGRQTLARFARGVIDQKIKEQEMDAVMVHIADRQPDGSWQLRNQVSDDELKKFLAAAKEAANKAEVPDQPETVDPSEELKQIIDKALNEQAP